MDYNKKALRNSLHVNTLHDSADEGRITTKGETSNEIIVPHTTKQRNGREIVAKRFDVY